MVWREQENPIYNINRFVLQEMGILLGGCLTVKNQWGLLTGDDGVGFSFKARADLVKNPTS